MVNYNSKAAKAAKEAFNNFVADISYKKSCAPGIIGRIDFDRKVCDVTFGLFNSSHNLKEIPYVGTAVVGNDCLLISSNNNLSDINSLIVVALI